MPSSQEAHLRTALHECECTLALLLEDCTGSALIASLQERVDVLEAQAERHRQAKDRCTDLAGENKRLEGALREERAEARRLKADLAYSYSINRDREKAIEKLKGAVLDEQRISHTLGVRLMEALDEIKRLAAQLSRNSDNSSMPPSVCPNKKKRIHNSRVKTGRKPGAQPGHVWHGRKRQTADRAVEVPAPDLCPDCGGILHATGAHKSRQVVDIAITLETVEYRSGEHSCERCGGLHYPAFPDDVKDDVNYAGNIKAIATFLTSWCNVSIDNVRSFLYEATGHRLELSKGFIHNCLASFSAQAKGAIGDISAAVSLSPVVNSDATFVSTSGKRSYIYAFLSPEGVVYRASDVKGIKPLYDSLLKDYAGIIVHDNDVSYYNFGSGHAECNAHILRYLRGIEENEPAVSWPTRMHGLLTCANKTVKAACAQGLSALPQEVIDGFHERYEAIIETARAEYEAGGPYNPKYKPEGIKLFKRLDEYRGNHLLFLRDLGVPFTNNDAEKALRRAKKKMGQTGGFRSTGNGSAYYCDVLTIAQTAAMRDMGVLGSIRGIFEGKTDAFKSVDTEAAGADP
jgi:hypothetical protein